LKFAFRAAATVMVFSRIGWRRPPSPGAPGTPTGLGARRDRAAFGELGEQPRLSTAADDTTLTPYSTTYSYLANSPLVGQIVFTNNGRPVMTTTKQ
jgi:hypothetical protein